MCVCVWSLPTIDPSVNPTLRNPAETILRKDTSPTVLVQQFEDLVSVGCLL